MSTRASTASDPARPCPCGRGMALTECCGRFLAGTPAPTAEQLMRSRYTAFALGDRAYLLRTWHRDRRPRSLVLDPRTRWTGLEVLGTTGGGPFHREGTVEFRAYFVEDGTPGSVHEHSRFVRSDDGWLYLDAAGPVR